MKTLRITKNLEANLRKKYLNNINTDADLVSLVGVQYDRVVVDVDSSKSGSKTMYEHDGTSWVFIAKVSDIEHELIFTEDRNIYITDKDRKLMKMGDVLPFEDIDDIVAKDPAILNKLFITKKGKIYFYNEDGEYKLVSGGSGAGGTNRLADVNAYADIATSYPKPDDYSAVVVLSDENHDGQKTWYIYEENVWNYQGIYFPETLEIKISLANTRELDIIADTDYTLPLEYLVGKCHLEIYLDGELLVKDTDYVEVGTDSYMSKVIQFKNTIPIESRLMFKRVVSSYMGDSMISRMSKESWMKYFEEAYSDFDNKIKEVGLTLVKNRTPEVINITSTTQTLQTLELNKPIGYQYLVRKIGAGTNVIEIKIGDGTVEKISKSGLTSISLTSDGDFWILEKVSNTRWELLDGFETGSNTNGSFKKEFDGEMICSLYGTEGITTSTWTYPKEFLNTPVVINNIVNGTESYLFYLRLFSINKTNLKYFKLYSTNSVSLSSLGNASGETLNLHAKGRWY